MGRRECGRESDLPFEFLFWDFYYAGWLFRPMGRREYRRELDLGVGGSVGGSQTSVLNFYLGISTTLADSQTYG